MAERIYVEELLSHSNWLRHLARGLVADHHAADDLVQESLFQALQDPPRERSGLGLKSWLRRVVTHRAWREHRDRGRADRVRRRRGQDEAAEASPAVDLVARTEIQGELIQALLALEEPYRTTILRSYFEGESSAAIARADGVPESTVRNRLRRGLERLRMSLRRRYRGDDQQWLAALGVLTLPTGVPRAVGTGMVLALGIYGKIGVAAAALLGLFLLGRGLLPADPAPYVPDPGAPLVADPASVEATEPAAEDAGQRLVAEEPPGAEPAVRDSLLEVRVLTSDGAPAAAARILSVARQAALGRNRARGGPDHPHSERYRFAWLAETYGAEALCDSRGRCYLSLPEDRLLLAATAADGSFASASISAEHPTTQPVVLRLRPRESLVIETVDAQGEPVPGMPLKVAVRMAEQPDNTLWTGASDESGRAVIDNFQLLRPDSPDALFGASFAFPLAPPAPVALFEQGQEEPLRLLVPPHGRMRLRFEDECGDPVRSPILYLRIAARFASVPAEDSFPAPEKAWIRGYSWAGERDIDLPVGLGAQVEVQGELSPSGEFVEQQFAGPTLDGQVLEHRLQLTDRWTVLRGRLLWQGQPLVPAQGGSARAVFRRQGRDMVPRSLDLDPTGAFELLVRRPDAEASLEDSILTVTYTAEDGEQGAVERGVAAVPCADLGELKLTTLERSLSGQVVDDRGLPIAGTTLQVLVADGAGAWSEDRRFVARSGDDGRFRLALPEELDRVALRPRHPEHVPMDPEPLRWPRSEPIEMARVARLEGRLLLPEGVSASLLRLQVTEPGGRVRDEELVAAGPGRARIARRGRRPGTHRLRLFLSQEKEPCADLGQITLEPGEQRSLDAELDLRARIQRYTIQAVDRSGAPLALQGAGFTARWQSDSGQQQERILLWDEFELEFFSSRSELQLECVARGYRSVRRTIVPGLTVLQMQRQ